MTIHLPDELKSTILAAVHSGRYASLDDAMTDAARMLVQRLRQEQAQEQRQPAPHEPTQARAPLWEVVDELRKHVPPEELAKLPKDGAKQLDHYL